jgi:hypothetical protein
MPGQQPAFSVGEDQTVANILKREGIDPAPTRGIRTPWSVFLKAHWRSLVAADFLTVDADSPQPL